MGFIGKALTKHFLNLGYSVIGVDDLSTGIYEKIYNPNYTFRNHHISEYESERFLLKVFENVDILINCAATVGVKNVMENPTYTIENNLGITKVMLLVAQQLNKHIILCSSSEVYGKNTNLLSETDDVHYGPSTKLRWSYAASKLIDEFLALDLYRKKQVPITILRFFNISGPSQLSCYGMAIPKLVEQALSGKPITVFGDGSQTRCFTHIDDVCKIIGKMIDKKDEIVGEIYNIGNPQKITIKRLAEYIKDKTQSSSEIKYHTEGQFYDKDTFEDMQGRQPNIWKLQHLLRKGEDKSVNLFYKSWEDIVDELILSKS